MTTQPRTSRKALLAACLAGVAALALPGTRAAAQPALANPDFEQGELGKVPAGWTHPASSANRGFRVALALVSDKGTE
jgi:hypothetical protein